MPDNRTTSRNLSFWDPNDPKWAGFQGQQKVRPEPQDANTDQLLGEARYTLLDQAQNGVVNQSRRDAEAAYPDPQAPQQGLRGFTDFLEEGAGPVGLASIPLRPLGALAGGMLVPGGVRKLIAPQEDESRWGGAGQLGLAALAMLGVKGKAPAKLNTAPKPAGWVGKGISDYSDDVSGVGANVEGLNTPSLKGLTSQVKKPLQLPESWKQFASSETPKVPQRGPRPSRARKAPAEPQSPENMIAQMNQESRSALKPRNVPSSDNPYLDMLPEGGMDTITPAEWSKLGLRQVRESTPSHVLDEAGEYGTNLLGSLEGNAKRLGIPKRARDFRNNTPFSE